MRTVTQAEPTEQPTEKNPIAWLHVRVSRELKRAASIAAAENETNIAAIVERALAQYLGRGKAA